MSDEQTDGEPEADAPAVEEAKPLKPESNVGITDAPEHPQPTEAVTDMDPDGFTYNG